MAKTYTVKPGQSLYDCALVNHGTVEAVFAIINLNNGFDINTQLTGGQIINIPDAYPGTNTTQKVFAYLSSKPVKPATQQQQDYRITEEGDKRLTEDNHNRIVNGQ